METLSYQKEVKAKKEHRCSFCNSMIREGMTYITSTHKQDGKVYDWKSHTYCDKIADKLNMYDEECDEGLTQDSFQEHIYHAYLDLMISKFPEDEISKYSDVIQQLRHVNFHDKLMYTIRHYKIN